MKELENKVALVTAATRGIGFACAKKLAQEGATVYIGAYPLEEGKEVCEQAKKDGLNMNALFFNALDENCYADMVNTVLTNEGKIDILINNFGTDDPKKDFDLENTDQKFFFDILEANLGSVYRTVKLVLPSMIKNNYGTIINISSVAGTIPDTSRIAYGVSKAAINNITQQIAIQYAKNNIRCNAILPGMTDTGAITKMPDEFKKSFLIHVPLNRLATAEDMANAAFFFGSDNSSFVTGCLLEVSGGYHLGTPQYGDFLK